MHKVDSSWEAAVRHRELSSVLHDDPKEARWGDGGRDARERGDICTLTADPRSFTAETSTAL